MTKNTFSTTKRCCLKTNNQLDIHIEVLFVSRLIEVAVTVLLVSGVLMVSHLKTLSVVPQRLDGDAFI